jgi:hypothetical protein
MLGEVTVSVRMRMPAPFLLFCCASASRRRAGERAPGADLAVVGERLRAVRIVELQHRGLRKTSHAPSVAGCSGLPSILVGRPSWLSTSTPLATPFSVTAVA